MSRESQHSSQSTVVWLGLAGAVSTGKVEDSRQSVGAELCPLKIQMLKF